MKHTLTKALTGTVAATAVAVAMAGPAMADSRSFGDCTLSANLVTARSTSWLGTELNVRAKGNVNCAYRHAYTNVTVKLKVDGTVIRSKSGSWTNSYGTGDGSVRTDDYWSSGCRTYQGVLTVNISGLGESYVTTGAPQTICS